MVMVRSLESVHSPRYFRFCNVLHIWTIRAIPTYRVYRLYDTCSYMFYFCFTDEEKEIREILSKVDNTTIGKF